MPEMPAYSALGPEAAVLDLSERMSELAASGQWAEVEDLALRLQTAIVRVPAPQRRALLAPLQIRLSTITREAKRAMTDVSSELGQLRRGQDAARAYGQG